MPNNRFDKVMEDFLQEYSFPELSYEEYLKVKDEEFLKLYKIIFFIVSRHYFLVGKNSRFNIYLFKEFQNFSQDLKESSHCYLSKVLSIGGNALEQNSVEFMSALRDLVKDLATGLQNDYIYLLKSLDDVSFLKN